MKRNCPHLTVLHFLMFIHDVKFLASPQIEFLEIIIKTFNFNKSTARLTTAGLIIDPEKIPDRIRDA